MCLCSCRSSAGPARTATSSKATQTASLSELPSKTKLTAVNKLHYCITNILYLPPRQSYFLIISRIHGYELPPYLDQYDEDALPAWGGIILAELINKVDASFRRLSAVVTSVTITKLMEKSNYELFLKMDHGTHYVIYSNARPYANLRVRGHPYQLPERSSDLHKRSSYSRQLNVFASSYG